ncbi:MAG: TatD family hydrolase [Vicinamibacterales bacterium]
MLIDSHCHLADEVFVADLPAVVERAHAAGVTGALCILSADEPAEIERVTAVRAAWPGVLFAAGIHPHRAGQYGDAPLVSAERTAEAVQQSQAMAVGEIGLDYHYDHSPREIQREVFAAQLEVARLAGLPVAIHTREATDDTLAIIRQAAGVRGVMHCFSGTVDEARAALELGFYVSLSGILTFPRSGNLRDLAAFVPDDRLLIETDAPFLAPVPHRGKRNEPAWVAETFAVLAATRGTSAAALAERLATNFSTLIARTPLTQAR